MNSNTEKTCIDSTHEGAKDPKLTTQTESNEKQKNPLVPKDYLVAPVFAASKQTGSRIINIKGKTYEIGGFNPLNPSDKSVPALDIRHGRAIFVLLSFRDSYNDSGKTIKFSMNEFCRRYAGSNGGRYSRDIREILSDLLKCWFRVTENDGTTKSYRIIEKIQIETKPIRRKNAKLAEEDNQMEIWLDKIELSTVFNSLFREIEDLSYVRIDVMKSITSPLAQAIYAFLPSRAQHHSSTDPFEITLSNILEQVGHRVPSAKWERKKIFTQNKTSVINQLDETKTLSGTLRAKLAETNDKSDYKIQCWVEISEKRSVPRSDFPLLRAWMKSGRSREDFYENIKNLNPLDEYQQDLLIRAQVKLKGNETFFEMARALLGDSQFNSLLSEVKGFALEGLKAKKNPTARLIYLLMEAISSK